MVWSTVTKPVYTAEQQIIALLIENVPKKMFLSVPKNPVDTACCRKQHNLMFRKIPFPPSWVSVQHLKALISLYCLKWLNILLFICSLFYNDDASQRTDNLSVELWSDKSQVSSNAMWFFSKQSRTIAYRTVSPNASLPGLKTLHLSKIASCQRDLLQILMFQTLDNMLH